MTKCDETVALRRRTARRVRQEQGLGLRETAREAGISASHLSMFERGRAGLSVPALHRLMLVLGRTEMAEFLSHDDHETAA